MTSRRGKDPWIGRWAWLVLLGLGVACGGQHDAVSGSEARPGNAPTGAAPTPPTQPGVATPTGSEAAELREGDAADLRIPNATDSEEPGEPVSLEQATRPLRMEIVTEFGYEDADGRLILDVLERDYLYLTLWIEDADKRPVEGMRPTVTPQNDSRFMSMTGDDVTDPGGAYSFALVGGSMGEEEVIIDAGGTKKSVFLNVISMRAAGYAWLEDIEGVLEWTVLFEADVEWGEKLTATYPESILAHNGKNVKLAGFMVPLEMTRKQKHFVLASNPPGCYFHVPGGPAGAVEVFAEKPIPMGWDPVVVEGRFEALESSEMGVLYRLHDAEVVQP